MLSNADLVIVNKIKNLVRALKYQEALDSLSFLDKDSVELHKLLETLLKAQILINNGESDEARLLIRELGPLSVKEIPCLWAVGQVKLTLAETFILKGDLLDAEILIKKALILFNEDQQQTDGKIDGLLALGRLYYLSGKYEKALATYQELYHLSRDQKFVVGQLRSLNNRAIILAAQGDISQALAEFREALTLLSNQKGLEHFQGTILNNFSDTQRIKGDYKAAEENLLKSLEIEKYATSYAASYSFQNLGTLYSELGDFNKAEIYLQKSIEIREEVKIHSDLGSVYGDYATHLIRKGELTKAVKNYEKAIALFQKGLVVEDSYQECLCEFVSLLGLMTDDRAYHYLEIANSLAIKHNSKLEKTRVSLELGKLNLAIMNIEGAIFHLNCAIYLARESGLITLEFKASLHKAEAIIYRYREKRQPEDLIQAQELLDCLIEGAEPRKLTPLTINLTILKGVLLSLQDEQEALKILRKAHSFAEDFNLTLESKRALNMIKELERPIRTDKETDKEFDRWIKNVQIATQRVIIPYDSEKELTSVFVVVFTHGMLGPSLLLIEPELQGLLRKEEEEEDMPKTAMYFTVALGQGGSYHQGLFGPLPVSELPDMEALVYCKSFRDEKAEDSRLVEQSYTIFGLIYPKKIDSLFFDRLGIQNTFEYVLADVQSISDLNLDRIREIKNSILAKNVPR